MKTVIQRLSNLFDTLLDHEDLLGTGLLLLSLLVRSNIHEELRNLVSILAGSWHFDRTCPVEIEVAQCVSQVLKLLLSKVRVILRHEEVSWQNTSLVRRSRCQEKVKLLGPTSMFLNKTLIDDAARRRIEKSALIVLNKEALRDSLIHYDDCDSRFLSCLVVEKVDSCLKLGNFSSKNLVTLCITNSISVNDDICGELILVVNCKGLNCFTN